mmetsp:Transcript_30158/g.69146  ORF Transcript_30158/g.69146 Transcript_30158/m.69146 type:complete len:251 (-) Transcript_30158:66-818(-)|eukprot:CAMPEP_0113300346 /NCGR_PEP_ID=MMETSP0010_2-20120614/2014_1 /TAXON_ID=216773 ORGANISM="Corethron hystrix, Strain 308" /NCGR_SAMPLE_ID=MMETSP0010_2 /ASSEMBLY_ACC=CAM_ASM_000155 /LENGTH=250 /DNA_ID=CAMNT_0000153755 /DNA_START=51 /DNA_END=803 /DNA_ORIENTATION=+ /assembly_acc=CAM_ASM_000155
MRSLTNRGFLSHAVRGIVVLLLFAAPIRADEGAHGKVVDLTDKTFEHLTQASTGMTTGSWFVKFYASWCGHCKSMAGAYDLLAMDEDLLAKGILLGKIEVPDNRIIGKRFDIKGFPTLYFLHRKKMYRYSGPRTLEAMKTFLLSGYEDSEALPIPQPPTFMDQVKSTSEQILYEIILAVQGKSGKTTQWAFILTGVLFVLTFLSLIFVLLMPVKTNGESPIVKDEKKETKHDKASTSESEKESETEKKEK